MFGQPLTKNIIGLPSTSTTIGWPSWPRSVPSDCDQIISRWLALEALICLRALCRSSAKFCPIEGQSWGFALFCSSWESELVCARAVPQAKPAARKIAAGAITLRQFRSFIYPPWVRRPPPRRERSPRRPRIGTGSSYLLQILGFAEIRPIPTLLHDDSGGKRRHPGRTWSRTHVGARLRCRAL